VENSLKIIGTTTGYLDISLNKLLLKISHPQKYSWMIMYLDGLGEVNGKSIVYFEEKVQKSFDGYILDWEELLEISLLPDIFDILIIGDEKAENLHKYDSDKEMIESCDFTIELVDSSYFLVNSRNTRFLEVLKAEFGGISCQWE